MARNQYQEKQHNSWLWDNSSGAIPIENGSFHCTTENCTQSEISKQSKTPQSSYVRVALSRQQELGSVDQSCHRLEHCEVRCSVALERESGDNRWCRSNFVQFGLGRILDFFCRILMVPRVFTPENFLYFFNARNLA